MNPDEVLLGVAAPSSDVCGVAVFRCQCVRVPGHEPPHGCDCGGAWTGEGAAFAPVTLPHDPLLAELGLPASVAGVLYGGVRRGGVRWPIPPEEGPDG